MQGRARLLLFVLSCSLAPLTVACAKDDPTDDHLSAPAPIVKKPGVGSGDGTGGGLPDPVGSSSGGGATACTEVTVAQLEFLGADETYATYQAVVTSASGRTGGLTLLFATHDTRSEDLGSTTNANYRTCEYCTFADDTKNVFFQKSGTLAVDGSSDLYGGTLHAKLTDATYIESTFDDTTSDSTPTPGGGCLHVASADIDVTK